MKKLKKRIFLKRMTDADLNRESINAANHYIKKRASGAPLTEKTAMLNYTAHGFGMGIRWMEEQLGAKNGTKQTRD